MSIFLSVQSQISPTNLPRRSRSACRCAPQAYVKDQYLYKSKVTLAPRMRPASPHPPCLCAPHMHRRYSEISIYNFNTSPASTGLLTYYRSAPHFHIRIDPPRPPNSTNPLSRCMFLRHRSTVICKAEISKQSQHNQRNHQTKTFSVAV